jgi:SNF2 family DNA or RNA helicase
MNETTRSDIRNIFLSRRQSCALMTASLLLGMTLKELKKEIEDGAIVAVSNRLGQRIPREELIAVAMQKWDQATIEEALGDDAAAVLPEAIRLVELQARIPRYQRDMLRWLARRDETTIDAVLSRELEDVACAHAEELATAVPGFEAALGWS